MSSGALGDQRKGKILSPCLHKLASLCPRGSTSRLLHSLAFRPAPSLTSPMLPTRQPAQFIILCCFHAAHWIQNVPAVHCKPPTVGIMEPMHVEGAEARPWSDRHLSDHLPSGTVPEIRDFQPLSRIQTRQLVCTDTESKERLSPRLALEAR
ncbi:hypothetical protein MJO28_008565 [Puccinia striiformis f. sp. tritici]|uniref:Uncharacterized protein n=1 Tax=Puccinia striiformis f. sp. tritici TaxID=168172 RepID=A0ACC0EBI8_9BASI|nr:hypothetical protein MJO28_008565 [Puccinia striiformis f. sp. tritici]